MTLNPIARRLPAASLTVAGAADDLQSGVTLAAERIDSGSAHAELEALIEATRSAVDAADELPAGTAGRAAALGIAVR
ncbi:MAG: hypothetical protein ACYC6T_16560 [Thermoleophilia bacterium]